MTSFEHTPIKAMIVDDSALIRQIINSALSEDPSITVVGTAATPMEAREKIKQLNPDVLTLDVEMPGMDGISFLEKIMTLRPMPVVMVSTLTQKGADASVRAMELGAIDCIGKPLTNVTDPTIMQGFKAELLSKVRVAASAQVSRSEARVSHAAHAPVTKAPAVIPAISRSHIIGIGSSTGGVQALHSLLPCLPNTLPPIAIVQHIQEKFVSSFVHHLAEICPFPVHEVTETMHAEPGHAYVATGGRHLEIHKEGSRFMCRLGGSELHSNHLPSADVMFSTMAKAAGEKAVGIILTGMGRDGAQGLLDLRKAGAFTIGQDEASCVVYGMPRAAKEIGAVEKECSLIRIAPLVAERFK